MRSVTTEVEQWSFLAQKDPQQVLQLCTVRVSQNLLINLHLLNITCVMKYDYKAMRLILYAIQGWVWGECDKFHSLKNRTPLSNCIWGQFPKQQLVAASWGPEHAICSRPLGWPCLFIPLAYTDLECLRTSPCPSGSRLLTLCCLIHPRHSLVTRLVNSSHPEPLWQVYPPPPLELALRTRGTLMALHRARICSWSCSSLKGKESSYTSTGEQPVRTRAGQISFLSLFCVNTAVTHVFFEEYVSLPHDVDLSHI